MCIRDRPIIVIAVTWAGLNALYDWYIHQSKRTPAVGTPNSSDQIAACLLYTSDAADERSSVDLGGRRIIKKKKNKKLTTRTGIGTSKIVRQTSSTKAYHDMTRHTQRSTKGTSTQL